MLADEIFSIKTKQMIKTRKMMTALSIFALAFTAAILSNLKIQFTPFKISVEYPYVFWGWVFMSCSLILLGMGYTQKIRDKVIQDIVNEAKQQNETR